MIINKNKILKIFLLILVLFSNIHPILAIEIKSDSDGSVEKESDWLTGKGSYTEDFKRIDYTYQYRLGIKKTISVNAYNLDGESLIYDSIDTTNNKKNKSGTWIGINVTENQQSYWEVELTNFEYTEVQRKFVCKYSSIVNTCKYSDPVCKTHGCSPSEEFAGYGTTQIPTGEKDEEGNPITESQACAKCKSKIFTGTEEKKTEGSITADWWRTPVCPSTKGSFEDPCTGETVDWKLKNEYRDEFNNVQYADFDGNKSWETPKDAKYVRVIPVESETEQEKKGNSTKEYKYSENVLKEVIEKLKKDAKALIDTEPTELKYIKVNEYPEKLKNEHFGKIKGHSENGIIEEDNGTSGSYSIDYTFNPSDVCINAKTAKVYYEEDCNKTSLIKPTEKITLENGTIYDENLKKDVTFWRYFIPLDTKSESEFYLKLIKNVKGDNGKNNGNYYNVNECESIMKDTENYQNYILKTNGDLFKGNYSTKKTGDKQYIKDTKNDDEKKNIACKLNVKIDFPIEQLFYNEIEKNDKLKFKGFNFYYRPIDISNPFPNGLDDSSLWKDWYEDMKEGKKVNPDISDSYGDISYIATISNPEELRKYNSKNKYTSWDNMKLDGTSSFIGDGINSLGMIERFNENLYEVYKLGCGELNKDPNNQMLYIKACGDNS